MQMSEGVWMVMWVWVLLSPAQAVLGKDEDDDGYKLVNVFIEHDPGKPGASCTEDGRLCISGAECVQKQCVCPDQQPKGDPLIACAREDEHLCVASLDPDIVAFNGASARVSLPCRHRLTYFITNNTADSHDAFPFCALEVFALTNVTEFGVFYQRGFDMTLLLGDFFNGKHEDFRAVHIKKMGLVEENLYKYVVSGDHRGSPLGGPVAEDFQGVTVECFFQPRDNIAQVLLPQCGVQVIFRPYNNTGDTSVQPLKPGIVIKAPGDAIFERRRGGFPGSLCTFPQDDPEVYAELARGRRLRGTTTALTYEALIVGVPQQGGHWDEECSESQDIVAHCDDREDAVNTCNRIFTHRQTLRCLLELKINVMLTFQNCLEFFCFNNKKACDYFTSHLNQCSKTHKFLTDIQCPPS